MLQWRGLTAKQIRRRLGATRTATQNTGAVYLTLVRMTKQLIPGGSFRPAERPGAPLFEGGGNWGDPDDPLQPACWPHYNSCRLTVEGERIAWELLRRFPEYLKGPLNEK